MQIYPADIYLFDEVKEFAHTVARHLNVELFNVEAKSKPLPDTAVGLCYYREKRICVTLRFKDRVIDGGKWWKHPLDKKEIMETVIHEVCHLRHCNHGKEFRKLEKETVEYFKQ